MTEYERRVFEARTTLSNARGENRTGADLPAACVHGRGHGEGVFSSASRIDGLVWVANAQFLVAPNVPCELEDAPEHVGREMGNFRRGRSPRAAGGAPSRRLCILRPRIFAIYARRCQ